MDDTLCTLVAFFSSQFDSVLKFLEFEWPTRGSIIDLSYFRSSLVLHLLNILRRCFVIPRIMWAYSHTFTARNYWWFVEGDVTSVVAYVFLPQNFGNVVGTYE